MGFQRKTSWVVLAVAAAALSACGGGGSDTTPAARITSVKVMGDSLVDSGTFGYKFTVQGAAPTGAGSTPVWSERIASEYGVTLCPKYQAITLTTFNTVTGCTNYGVGGGRINNFTAPTSPVSITKQMADAGSAGFGAGDLVLIDGGGNDAADLVGAYLSASKDGGATYAALLMTLLPPSMVDAAFAGGATGMAQIGGAYMIALADKFAASISADVLGKGAQRVAILNLPSLENTPRLQQALGGVAASAGPAASAQFKGLVQTWGKAFNNQLTAKFGVNNKVVLVDFYTSLNEQVANPSQFALTNAKSAACAITGMGNDGLPDYDLSTCTVTLLSAMAPPEGATGGTDWWKTYAFADGLHPTPYGHQLLSQLVARSIAQAGWL